MSATRVIRGGVYYPTAPRSGSVGDAIFRMQNLFKRGAGDAAYHEAAGGPQNLSETIATSALTGTIALTANSQTVTGTGTSFKTELHLGQFVLANDSGSSRSFLLVVERIDSATSFIASRAPTASVSGLTAHRLPRIFPVDSQRGTCIWGNVVRLDRGTLFSAGDGVFRLNGSALSGSSLTLTRDPKVSIYNSGTGNYTHYTLGLPVPTGQTATNVAGGTKGMEAANYSFVVTAERKEYPGFGNPSARLDVTLTAGERPQIDFGSMDATSGQDAWGIWGTRYADSIGADRNYVNGPWFRVMAGSGDFGQVIAADLGGGDTLAFEYLDAEIEGNPLITFDNDAPPDAEFVAFFNSVPVWISCMGPGETSPGPFIFPAKPGNIEAAPPGIAYPTSPPELIIGVVPAMGRLYLLTTNHLQIAQGTQSDTLPVIVRPFWKSGFKNPYQLTFVNGVLYGNTTAGPARSIGEGDEQEAEKTWADAISEFTRDWVTGHVLVAHDPLDDTICYFHPAYSLNASGFWTTRVWVWGLTEQEWIADVLLSSTTQDYIVCGVATVGDYLEFLMGGRLANNTVSVGTYRWETGSGPTSYYLAPGFSDSATELRTKRLGPGFRVTGKLTSASLKVYGAVPGQTVPVSDLEAGTNALATLALTDGSDVTEGVTKKANVKNLKQHTVRVEGVWNGSGERDRVDEVMYEVSPMGARR